MTRRDGVSHFTITDRMTKKGTILVALAYFSLIGASDPPKERLVAGNGIVNAILDGAPVRLRVDPAAPGAPLIAQPLAEQLGLRLSRRLGIGFVYSIGPVHVTSSTAETEVNFGSGPEKQRVVWTSKSFSPVGDGSVGPAGVPEPVVRFQLRPTQGGETTISLPIQSAATLFGPGSRPTYSVAMPDGEPMRILFDPHHARTLATAGAAVRLARAFDGTVSGAAIPTEIFWGVERPVRTLTLNRPFALGSLKIQTLGVRTSDFGTAAAIRDANAPVASPDPDEIIVIGKGKKRDIRRDMISLGADALARCSSIVFDKPARLVRLTCR